MNKLIKQLCIIVFLMGMGVVIKGMAREDGGASEQPVSDVDELLADALRSEDLSLMAFSLDSNPSAQAKNLTLIQSAYDGNAGAVRMLLACNVDVNACNKYAYTALMQASYKNNLDVIEALLEARADLESCNRYGWTALIIASYSGSADVVQKLLVAGANLRARDADGRTALTLASSGGHMEVVQKLLESGADITPYDCVVTKESGYIRLEELLTTVKGLREEWRDCPLEIINVEIVPYIFSGEAPTKWIIYMLCRTFYCSLCDGNKLPR